MFQTFLSKSKTDRIVEKEGTKGVDGCIGRLGRQVVDALSSVCDIYGALRYRSISLTDLFSYHFLSYNFPHMLVCNVSLRSYICKYTCMYVLGKI